jgi:hypothetical protein
MPLNYVRRLTVVSLLVCTNTKGSGMYYNMVDKTLKDTQEKIRYQALFYLEGRGFDWLGSLDARSMIDCLFFINK